MRLGPLPWGLSCTQGPFGPLWASFGSAGGSGIPAVLPATKTQPSYNSEFIISEGNGSHQLDQGLKLSLSSHSALVLVSDVFSLSI